MLLIIVLILLYCIEGINSFKNYHHHNHYRHNHHHHYNNKDITTYTTTSTILLCNNGNSNDRIVVNGNSNDVSLIRVMKNTVRMMVIVSLTLMIEVSLPVIAADNDITTITKNDNKKNNDNGDSNNKNDNTDTTTTATTTTDETIDNSNNNNKINEKLLTELVQYEEDLASFALKQQNEPKTLIENIKRKYSNRPVPVKVKTLDELKDDREKVLTLKAYLDEAERDLFQKNWDNLQVYLYTFADQENAFANLIDGLFPSNDKLDRAAREALSFEAKSMFLALDDLREAAKLKQDVLAQKSYAKLLVSYDRFLKAGDLYPTYDPITSTAIFFEGTPPNTLRYDARSKVQVLDTVLLTSGPDMGKTGTIINIDGNNAIVKLDKDGKAYQEVKFVKIDMLAKTLDDNKNDNDNNKNIPNKKGTIKKN